MKHNFNKIKYLYTLIIPILLWTSCSKSNDYKKFAEGGEISYTGKIDSVTVYSGDERVIIKGLFLSDPKVASCRIYWNNMRDSVEVPVKRTHKTDTLIQIIKLPENLHNFRIHTFDALGNKSVAVYATGRSYGKAYKESINNRLIVSAIADNNRSVTVTWRDMDKTLLAIGTEVTYTDHNNNKKLVNVPIDQAQTILKDYKEGTSFSYQTLYIPDTLCIDTFRTKIEQYQYAQKIGKKNWTATADTYEPTGQLPYGGHPSFAIDDDPNTYWHTVHSSGTTNFPHWLAFDMKKAVKVDMVELTSRRDHFNADFRDFIIEGRDSELEPWKAYGTFTLSETAEPQKFLIADSPSMRFIRIYQLNGGGEPHSHLAEFSVYGN